MSTHHEPTDPDRIVRLARGVLDDYERIADWNKPRSRSGREMPPYEVMFARTVIDLTARLDHERFAHANTAATVKRVEALAEQYDSMARLERREGDVSESINTQATADRIRAALSGEGR